MRSFDDSIEINKGLKSEGKKRISQFCIFWCGTTVNILKEKSKGRTMRTLWYH